MIGPKQLYKPASAIQNFAYTKQTHLKPPDLRQAIVFLQGFSKTHRGASETEEPDRPGPGRAGGGPDAGGAGRLGQGGRPGRARPCEAFPFRDPPAMPAALPSLALLLGEKQLPCFASPQQARLPPHLPPRPPRREMRRRRRAGVRRAAAALLCRRRRGPGVAPGGGQASQRGPRAEGQKVPGRSGDAPAEVCRLGGSRSGLRLSLAAAAGHAAVVPRGPPSSAARLPLPLPQARRQVSPPAPSSASPAVLGEACQRRPAAAAAAVVPPGDVGRL